MFKECNRRKCKLQVNENFGHVNACNCIFYVFSATVYRAKHFCLDKKRPFMLLDIPVKISNVSTSFNVEMIN